MKPDLNELKDMKKDLQKNPGGDEIKRIPVYEEIYADAYTPVEVIRRLRAVSRHVFLLESASQDESWGRYTFLGYEPTVEITCQDGDLKIREAASVETGSESDKAGDRIIEKKVLHPGDELRKIIAEYKTPVVEGLPPFTGGLVGYFSYDYIKYSEPKLHLSSDQDFKDMDLMLFNEVIAFDHYKQKIYLISGVRLDDLDASYDKACRKIAEIKIVLQSDQKYDFKPIRLKSGIKPKFDLDHYCQMIDKAKHYIREGDIFQVVLSNPLTAEADGNLFDTYRVLRATNPSPYMFYFTSDDVEIAGASPETLARLDNGRISSFPLAGTRPRGKTDAEDKELIKGLLSDEKELAEHNMLVDLGRNDVGKVSKIGSVKVEKYLEIEKFSQVMHIGSTVTGQIRDDLDAIDAIDSILPAGTLSGAPKFRACEIIEELEKSQRGIYGGAIGYIDFAGNMDVCIAIRLVYKKNGQICIRSGAGIVADSVPEKEFQECQNKARAVVLAIEQAEKGI